LFCAKSAEWYDIFLFISVADGRAEKHSDAPDALFFLGNYDMKFVLFFLNQDRYALSVAATREVNRLVNIRVVDKAPAYVLGLINLHGLITPLLNLKKLLHIKPSHIESHTKWIAVQYGNTSACLTVDKLERIIEIPRERLDDVPTLSTGPDTNCFKVKDSIISVLAAGNLLTDKQREIVAQIVHTFQSKE
jgi:purine-binding chemotaxis protein CheW